MDVAERDEVCTVDAGDNYEDKTVERSLSKNLKRATGYLTPKARLAFTKLKKTFIEAPILQYFDPKCHIRIKTDASGYAIGRVKSQLTSNNLGWWYPVAFYLQKMTLAKTQYKTHDGELLAIVEASRT